MLHKVLKWGGIGVAVFVAWLTTILIASAVVKERVPVNLSPTSDVFASTDTYAVANGTWVIEGQKQAFPLQTTEIRCEKELRRCTSGTATVMLGDQLSVDVNFYEIISWEKSRIVFVDNTPKCVNYVYTIDLVTKVANAVRKKRFEAEGTSSECAGIDQELRLSLKEGFQEAYALQQESMPWFGKLALAPLKLLQ